MRVVLISRYPKTADKPRGGVESVTVILAQALANLQNLEVHLITLEQGLVNEQEENDGRVIIHRLPASTWPQITDIIMGPGRQRLLKKIEQLAPAIVHSHETFGLTLSLKTIPHVFTVHGFDHANILVEGGRWCKVRSLLWRGLERYSMIKQKHIISISPYVRSMIDPMTKARIYDIDNPVDERCFNIQRQEGKTPCVLCVGWINERKNTLGSVKAFAKAVNQGCDGVLIIAGDAKHPSYLAQVKREVANENISDRVEFLGHISHEQLIEELARASVLLLPSLQENAPMAVAEAMAAAIPVIASDRCGMPYMIEDGCSGFLLPPLNTDNIADKLIDLLRSRDLREKMGKRGREIALERFHPDVVARKTKEVYESML